MKAWSFVLSVIPRVAAVALPLLAIASCGGKVVVDEPGGGGSSSGSSGGDDACCSQPCCAKQVIFLQTCGMEITCAQAADAAACLCQPFSFHSCDEVLTCISP